MRIGHAIYLYLPMTENWIHDQIVGLSRYHEQVVLAGLTENLDHFPVQRLVCFDGKPAVNRLFHQSMRKLNSRYVLSFWRNYISNTDLLHSHFGDEGYRNYHICRRFRKKHIVSFYGYDLTDFMAIQKWRKRFREMFRNIDAVITEGNHARRTIVEAGCEPSKVVVNHLGVDLTRVPDRIRETPKSRPVHVLMAAAFAEKKGLVYGIEALGKLLRSGMNIELTLIGDSRSGNGPVKNAIISSLDNNSLMPHTRLLGFVPYETFILECLSHDVFVSPSVTTSSGGGEGGAPVAFLHAQSTGLPVVSTLHCDIPEYVIDGTTGYLVEERSVDQLAVAIEKAVSNIARLSANCRRHVAENYDLEHSIENLNKIYEQVV